MAPNNEVSLTITAVNNTQRAFAEVQGAFQSLTDKGISGLGNLLTKLSAVNPAMLGIGASIATAGAAIGFLVSSFEKTVAVGSQLYDMSQKTGIAVEQLSQLRYVSDQLNVPMESLEIGVGRFSKQVLAAADSGSQAASYFKMLGVEVRNTDGTFKDTFQLMLAVSDKFAGMTDGAAKTALAINLFGRGGKDLIPMLNEGSAAIQKMMERANALGLSFTKEGAESAHEFERSLKDLKAGIDGVAYSTGEYWLPYIQRVVDLLSNSDTSKMRNEIKALDDQIKQGEDRGSNWLTSRRPEGIMGALSSAFGGTTSREDLGALRQQRAEIQAMYDSIQKQDDDRKKNLADETLDKKALADAIERNKERLAADEQFLKESLALSDAASKTQEMQLELSEKLGITSEQNYYAQKNDIEVKGLQTKIDTLEKEIQAELDAWFRVDTLYKTESEKKKAYAEVEKNIADKQKEIMIAQEDLEQKAIQKKLDLIEAAKKTADELKKAYGDQEKNLDEWKKYYVDCYDQAIAKIDELSKKSSTLGDMIKSGTDFLKNLQSPKLAPDEQFLADYKKMRDLANQPLISTDDFAQAKSQMEAFLSKYAGTDNAGGFSRTFEVSSIKSQYEDLLGDLRNMKAETDQNQDSWQAYANKVAASAQAVDAQITWLETRIKQLDQAVAFNRELALDTTKAEASIANLLDQIGQLNAAMAGTGPRKGSGTVQVGIGSDITNLMNQPMDSYAQIDPPGAASGTPYVRRSGLAVIHEGEAVLTKAQNANRGGDIHLHGDIVVNGAQPTPQVAKDIQRELIRLQNLQGKR